MNRDNPLLALIWKAHTAYFTLGSAWPLLSGKSFEWVTGRKHDMWLVKTVALLLGTVGVAIGRAGAKDRITPEIATIAVGSSASLTTIDVINVARGRISKVYLLDALANAILIGGWFAAFRRGNTASHT